MDELVSYLTFVICIVVGVGMISSLATDELAERAGGAARLICLFALIGPIASALGALPEISLPELGVQGSEFAGGYEEVSCEAFCSGVEAAIAERLEVDELFVEVEIKDFVFEEMRAGALYATLCDEAVLCDSRGLSQWLKENFVTEGGVCKVVIGLG